MPKRSPLVALTLLAGLLLAAIVWLFSSQRGLSTPLKAALGQFQPEEETTLQGPLSSPQTTVRRQFEERPAAPVAAAEIAEPQPLEDPIVHGTCVVIDSQGNVQTQVSGRFRVLSHRDEEREWASVEILSGQFEFSIPTPSSFFFDDFELYSYDASVRRGVTLSGPETDLRLDLVAHESRGAEFHVVDRKSGAHLSQVQVVHLWGFSGDSYAYPYATANADENMDFIVRGGSSPVPVERDGWDRTQDLHSYWVRAEGYAWVRVDVNFTFGGVYRVPLDPAGGLTARISDPEGLLDVDGGLSMMLRREEAGPPLSTGELDDRLECNWPALAPGSYVVSVEEVHPVSDGHAIGSARVMITPGATTRVTIQPASSGAQSSTVPCTGTLRTGSHWLRTHTQIEFLFNAGKPGSNQSRNSISREDLVQDPYDAQLFHWATELESPGSWQAISRYSSIDKDFEVGAEGAHGVELVIPDPVQLRLRIVDRAGGFCLRDPVIHTGYNGIPIRNSIYYLRTTFDRESGLHTLLLPTGELTLRLRIEGYTQVEDTLMIPPEGLQLTYALVPNIRIHPVYWDDDGQIAVSLLESKLTLRHLDGDGRLDMLYWNYFTVTEPGRYQVKIENIPFYPPLSAVIKVPQVGAVDVRFELAGRR
jgi:hypothetical protein